MRSTRAVPLTRATLVAVAALLLAACGGEEGEAAPADPIPAVTATSAATAATTAASPSSVDGSAAPVEAVEAVEAVDAAEAVVPVALVGATTIDGEPFDAEALAGRPTVAWFWAPWCVVCRGEAPDVAKVVAAYSDRVNFVGVAGRGEAEEMREFVEQTGVEGFVHLDDSSGDIWSAYEIYAQPAFAFITADGRLETFTGGLGEDDLARVVDQLIVA